MGIQLDYENDLGFNYIGSVLTAIPEELNAELLPKALKSGAYKLAGRIRKSAKAAGWDTEHHAKRNPPRAYGLYDSIRVGNPTPEHWPDPYVRVGATYARQVYLIEMGHFGPKPAPPHPFVIPAVLQGEDETIKAVTGYINQRWAEDVMKPALRKGRARGNRTPHAVRGRTRGLPGTAGSVREAAAIRGRGLG